MSDMLDHAGLLVINLKSFYGKVVRQLHKYICVLTINDKNML